MWTPELIRRLKTFVDASRTYKVTYRGMQVHGLDIPPEEYPIEQTAIYLQEYDDCPPDNFHTIDETKPGDFEVYNLQPVNWQES